eukprot:sb/3478903/
MVIKVQETKKYRLDPPHFSNSVSIVTNFVAMAIVGIKRPTRRRVCFKTPYLRRTQWVMVVRSVRFYAAVLLHKTFLFLVLLICAHRSCYQITFHVIS